MINVNDDVMMLEMGMMITMMVIMMIMRMMMTAMMMITILMEMVTTVMMVRLLTLLFSPPDNPRFSSSPIIVSATCDYK